MTNFFMIKEKVTRFYKNYEAYFQIAFKFLVAFFVFGYINDHLGYYPILNNIGIKVLLSLISAIVPSSIFVLLAAIVALLHLYKLSLVMMILAFVVFVVFYFLYLKFAPRHGVLMMIIPVLMPLNLHFIVPLIAGLFFSPFTIVPVACSFILMKVVGYIIEAVPMVGDGKLDVEAIVGAYQYVIDHVLDDREMVLYGVVFALMIVLTYVVSRFPFDYAWYIGIGLGTVAGIVGMLVGGGMFGVEISAVGVIFGALISGVFVALVQFLYCSVDYRHKEFVQFEDDDYYYYVRAIPKLAGTISAQPAPEAGDGKKGSFKESLKEMFAKDEKDNDVFNEDFDDVFEKPAKPERKRGGSRHSALKTRHSHTDAAHGKTSLTSDSKETSGTVSDKTQIFDKEDGRAAGQKQPEIIIPEIKVPERTAAANSAAKRGTPEPKPVLRPAKPKNEPKTPQLNPKDEPKPAQPKRPDEKPAQQKRPVQADFDFDFDDDGYDDSMEDYGSDHTDF